MSFSEWKTYQLGELLEVKYGKDHKALSEGKIPAYGSGGIMRYVDKAIYDEVSILIPRKGSLNNIYFLDKPFWTVDTMFWTKVNQKLVDPKFLYYKLTTFNYSDMNVGSAVPSMTVPVLNEMEIVAPDLKTQQRIASILSSLDDAIELNQQINKTLEEIAKAIFKEWFVDFNFPNATGKFQETEIGKIPVGWKVGKLGDIYKTTSGGTPSRAKLEYYENGIYQWVKSKELNGSFIIDTEERITDVALKNSSAKILPPKTVLLAMYGATVGEIGIISNEATCNQAICAIISSELSYTYIFQYLKNNKQNILNNAVGSAQQNISQEIIKDFPIIVPNITQVKEVMYKCELFFEQVELNVIENLHLKQTRDYLLPKLISGEIRVKEAIKKVKDLV